MEHDKLQSSIRLRHTDLQPLQTRHMDASYWVTEIPICQQPNSELSVTPMSAISLASPSLLAVRQHYREHGLQTAFQADMPAVEYRTRLSPKLPRRHSALSPGGLEIRMKCIAVSSPGALRTSIYGMRRQSVAEDSREILLRGINRSELARLGGVVKRRDSSPLSTRSRTIIEDPPFRNTQGRLRDWGRAYLGNTVTADIIVKAVYLSRAGNMAFAKSEGELKTGKLYLEGSEDGNNSLPVSIKTDIIVRAKILPETTHRKPFLIQRRFNLDEMQATLPKTSDEKGATRFSASEGILHSAPAHNAQSSFGRMRSIATTKNFKQAAALETENISHGKSLPSSVFDVTSRRVMPIHMEYALQYLPVLAALMVSGHVRKGDAVELPLPHPEAWREVISYIYTGDGLVTSVMKDNILYLGGRVDL